MHDTEIVYVSQGAGGCGVYSGVMKRGVCRRTSGQSFNKIEKEIARRGIIGMTVLLWCWFSCREAS